MFWWNRARRPSGLCVCVCVCDPSQSQLEQETRAKKKMNRGFFSRFAFFSRFDVIGCSIFFLFRFRVSRHCDDAREEFQAFCFDFFFITSFSN